MGWFRLYSDVLYDPKVQRLSPTMFKHWVNLLCLANNQEPRGLLPSPVDVGYALRMSEQRATVLLDELLALELLDADDEGNLSPHNWGSRQFASDARDTEGRKKADGARRREGGKWVNPAANARRERGERAATEQNRTETDTEADTEQNRTESQNARAFEPNFDPPFADDEEDFVSEYVKHRELLTGLHPGASQVSDAIQLQRDFGAAACIQVAMDTNWEKPPTWLRHKLKDRAAVVTEVPRPKSRIYDS